MATLTLTIPDAQIQRLIAAIGQQRGIDVSAMNTAQKIAMAKQDVVTYWKGIMQASEIPAAVNTATAAAITSIENNLQIT